MRLTVLACIGGVIAGLAAATLIAAGSVSEESGTGRLEQATAQEIDASEGGIVGARAEDGSLAAIIVAHSDTGGVQQLCTFDASVTLSDGVVKAVVQLDREDKTIAGEPVVSEDDAFQKGEFISVPAYRNEEGGLVIGYRDCKELGR